MFQALGLAIGRLTVPQKFARTPHFLGQVPLFGQAVTHRQDRLLVIDVQFRLEGESRDHRSIDVDQVPGRMFGEQVSPADLAPFTNAQIRFLISPDLIGTP